MKCCVLKIDISMIVAVTVSSEDRGMVVKSKQNSSKPVITGRDAIKQLQVFEICCEYGFEI